VWRLAADATTPTLLPFAGLREPEGVAVDSAGNLYITDANDHRVWKLDAGATTPNLLPFNDLKNPAGVAVDNAGNVYVADRGGDRVLKLAAGATGSTVLGLPGLDNPDGVAVDADGNIYVTDFHDQCTAPQGPCVFQEKTGRLGDGQVLKLAADSTAPTSLSFNGLDRTWSVSVDGRGDVYVADGNGRVLKLPVQA
jgi:serine/threonine-protein kinase